MALQVIGVGLGRTGTMSLKVALEHLGFSPCDHMINLIENPERVPLWLEAARQKDAGEPIDWEPLFSDYQATVDWPGMFFWRELVAAYPQAKVILTVRDPQRWYDSAAATILQVNSPAADENLEAYPPEIIAMRNRIKPLLDAVLFNGTFQGRAADRESAIATFIQHNATVQAEVPADRLLVYEVTQGWEPLCDFLGVPVPIGEPFPRVNDAATFRARIEQFTTNFGGDVHADAAITGPE